MIKVNLLSAMAFMLSVVIVSAALGAYGGASWQRSNLEEQVVLLKAQQEQLSLQLEAVEKDFEQQIEEAYAYQEVASLTMENMVLLMEETVTLMQDSLTGPDPYVKIAAAITQIEIIIMRANELIDARETSVISENIYYEATARGIDPLLITAMAFRESTFRTGVTGRAGENGLLQVMPGTGRWIAGKLGYEGYEHEWMMDPGKNIQFATYYLWAVTQDMARLGLEGEDLKWAGVLAYNAGPTGARRWLEEGNCIYDHRYVRRVKATYECYQ